MKDQDGKLDFATILAASVHDMKNSLCMMLQALDTLSAVIPASDRQSGEEFARLHYEASRLNGDLMHLLTLYRKDRTNMPVNVEEHYIDEMVEELYQKNALYLERRGISLERDIDVDLAWYFDHDLVLNLLNDVLVNAMRYCASQILIKAYISNNQLHLEILDDGPGYPPMMLELSADPGNETHLNQGRTGLGLYFAAMIAAAHRNNDGQGEINLTNGGPLGGSVFSLMLP